MRKVLISSLSLFLLSANLLFSQSIDETIAYLNKISYEHYGYFSWYRSTGGTVGRNSKGEQVLATPCSYSKTYDVFSIDSVGLITVYSTHDYYIIPAGTPWSSDLDTKDYLKVLKEKGVVTSSCSFYIKQISNSISISQSDIEYAAGNSYYVKLSCDKSSNCINIPGSTNTTSMLEFAISGEEYADRFKNAFLHLITLAKQNPYYWDKDPFE